MAIYVESRPGHHGAAEPEAFCLGARRLTVLQIVDRWVGAQQRWYKVSADDGDLYILRHDEADGAWQLAAYTRQMGPRLS